jgi:hypothetical protein
MKRDHIKRIITLSTDKINRVSFSTKTEFDFTETFT